MPNIARQSASVLAKLVSGGGENFGAPAAWSQTAYGSGWPIAPVEAPKDVALPRAINYPISVNSQLTPRTAYGLMPFASLLAAYNTVSEVSAPVNLIQRELTGFIPHLVDSDNKQVEDHPYLWMTQRPDGKTPFSVWLTRLLKSAKIYDAATVYLQREKSGAVSGLHYVDGSTLFVLIDQFGNVPEPEPVDAYVRRVLAQSNGDPTPLADFAKQYQKRLSAGQPVPAKIPAYTQVIQGTPFAWWSQDELLYLPQSRRVNAPYGESFIELAWAWIMVIVNITAFELGHYRTGNMPEGFVTLPRAEFGTVDAVMTAELMYNLRMAQNEATERNRLRFFPEGTTFQATKNPDFPTALYDKAWHNVLNAIGLLPSEFGEMQSGKLGGGGQKGAESSDVARHSTNPNRAFVASLFNQVLDADGVDDVSFVLDYPLEELDPEKQKQSAYEGMAHGTLTLNDALGQLNMMPVGSLTDKNNIANKHLIVAGTGIFVVEDLQVQNGMAQPTFGGTPGGNAGGAPASPESAVEAQGKEHGPQDAQAIEKLIRNVLDSGTLDGRFYSLPADAKAAPPLRHESGRFMADGQHGAVYVREADQQRRRVQSQVQEQLDAHRARPLYTQAEADYVDHASNPAERCALCEHFSGGGACRLVRGHIAPDGWCKYFEPPDDDGDAVPTPDAPPEASPITIGAELTAWRDKVLRWGNLSKFAAHVLPPHAADFIRAELAALPLDSKRALRKSVFSDAALVLGVRRESALVKGYAEIASSFQTEAGSLISDAGDEDISGQAFGARYRSALRRAGLQMFRQGMEDEGISPESLSAEQLATFRDWQAKTSGLVGDLRREAYSADGIPNPDARPDYWTNVSLRGVYYLGAASVAPDARKVWIVGDTEHCPTCLSRSGMVKTLSEWGDVGYPGDFDALDCHGVNCQCMLEDAPDDDGEAEKFVKYSPDQPRDEQGRFGEGASGTDPHTEKPAAPQSAVERMAALNQLGAHSDRVNALNDKTEAARTKLNDLYRFGAHPARDNPAKLTAATDRFHAAQDKLRIAYEQSVTFSQEHGITKLPIPSGLTQRFVKGLETDEQRRWFFAHLGEGYVARTRGAADADKPDPAALALTHHIVTPEGKFEPDIGAPGTTEDSLNEFLQRSNGPLAYAMADPVTNMVGVDYSSADDRFVVNREVVKAEAKAFVKESQDIRYGKDYMLQLAKEHAADNGVDIPDDQIEAAVNQQYATRAQAIQHLARIGGVPLTDAQERRLQTAADGDYLKLVYSRDNSERGTLTPPPSKRRTGGLSGAAYQQARANFQDWVLGLNG